MALWPFDDKKDEKKEPLGNEQDSSISEEELDKYLKENPPSEKVMEDISKPKVEQSEIPTEVGRKPEVPPLGPRPIPTNADFRPPSTKPQVLPQPKPPATPSATPPTTPAAIPPKTPKPVSPPVSDIDQSRGKPIIPANQPIPPAPPVKQPSKFKTFCSGIAILFVIIILAGAIWWYFLATGTLSLAIQPTDASIKVGSEAAKANDSLKLKPGQHTVKIEKDGYVTYEKEITIQRLKTIEIKIELKQIPKPEQISQDKFSNFYVNSNQIYALGADGKTLYQLSLNTEQGTQNNEPGTQDTEQNYTKKAITPDTMANIENIIWHPKDTLAIFKIKQEVTKLTGTPFAKSGIADGQIITWLYDFKRYDLVNQTATFWGADIGDIVWSPDGEKAYYYYAPAGGEITLISASKNNQNLERLLNLKEQGIENPRINISPDGKYLTLVPRSKQYETNYVYLFDIATKKLTKLVPEGHNLDTRFSPDSQKFIYSFYSANEEEPSEYSNLAVVGTDGGNKVDLKTRAFMNKVTFISDSKFVVAALSADKNSSERFTKIDLTSGAATDFVYQSEITIKPIKVLYSSAVDMCYFMLDGYIYGLEMVSKIYE